MERYAPVFHGPAGSVPRIAHYMPSPVRKLPSYLVMPPRYQFHQDDRVVVGPAQCFIGQFRVNARLPWRRNPGPLVPPGSFSRHHQPIPEYSLSRFRRRVQNGQVGAPHLSPGQSLLNAGEGALVPGQHNGAAHGLVNSVYWLQPLIVHLLPHGCNDGPLRRVPGLDRLPRVFGHDYDPRIGE